MAKRARGFSLLEVIVAFAILALMMGPVMHAFSGGLAGAARTGDMADALSLARSKTAEVGALAPLAAGRAEGRFGESKFHWRQVLSPTGPAGEDGRPLLYRVETSVMWRDGLSDRSVELITLRVGEAP